MIDKFNYFKVKKIKSEIETILHILTDDRYEVELLDYKEEDGENFLVININSDRIHKSVIFPFKQIERYFRRESVVEFMDRLRDICEPNGFKIFIVEDKEKLAHLTLKICS